MTMKNKTLQHAIIAAFLVATGVTVDNIAFDSEPELKPQVEITDAEFEADIHAYECDITYKITLPVQYEDIPGLPSKPAFVEFHYIDKGVIIKKTSIEVADLDWIKENVPVLDSTYVAVSVSRLRELK